jgi:hypothetical protein
MFSSSNSKTRTASVSTSGTNHREGRRPPYFKENEMNEDLKMMAGIVVTFLVIWFLIAVVFSF